MCGFIIAKQEEGSPNLIKLINEMSYRGEKEYVGYQHYLGYDLAHIALPMVDPDPKIAIQPIGGLNLPIDKGPPSMFVGEIFNYKDFGNYHTDALMIHHEYYNANHYPYPEFDWHKFDGFWSYITFSESIGDESPIIYTDFLGIKPVYYRNDYDCAASEPNVLKTFGPITPNKTFHSNVMKWGYDPTGGTPWNEIKQLKPGHYLFEGIETPYWDWDKVETTDLYSDLSYAVRNRLSGFRDAAILLSGGLDSTIIYQLIKATPNTGVTAIHVDNNEHSYAKLVEKNCLNVTLDSVTDEYAVEVHQSPVDLGSVKPQIAMAEKLEFLGFKNVLTGDGADELFGGYRRAKEYDSQHSDVFCELPYYHLPKLDRTMMRSTIELRAPFLSPAVIKHGLNTPYEMRNGEKKVLKETFKDIVPQEILNRDKLPLKTEAIRTEPMQQRIKNQEIWNELYG
jgi:asparagine synthetase B (glutamine-hydrolysing)